MWLHSPYHLADEEMNAQQPAQQRVANKLGVKKRPSLGGGKSLGRVNQFILPFYTMPPGADQKAARIRAGR